MKVSAGALTACLFAGHAFAFSQISGPGESTGSSEVFLSIDSTMLIYTGTNTCLHSV
jgi:hypothetical protein